MWFLGRSLKWQCFILIQTWNYLILYLMSFPLDFCSRYFMMLISQAAENLGMAMVYTLVTSAQEWLSERFAQDAGDEDAEEDEAAKDEVFLFPWFKCVCEGILCVKRASFLETYAKPLCIFLVIQLSIKNSLYADVKIFLNPSLSCLRIFTTFYHAKFLWLLGWFHAFYIFQF